MSRRGFDAIVIGAGQAGPPLVGRLTAAGMTVALVERKLVGGTCVNTGCMPTKTLVASAHAAHVARRAADYGVVLDAAVRVDMARVKARADAVTANARGGLEKWLRSLPRCTIVQGHARFEGPDRVRVGDELLQAPRIFVNVGGSSCRPRPARRRHGALPDQPHDAGARPGAARTWWSSAAATSASSSRRCTGASART